VVVAGDVSVIVVETESTECNVVVEVEVNVEVRVETGVKVVVTSTTIFLVTVDVVPVAHPASIDKARIYKTTADIKYLRISLFLHIFSLSQAYIIISDKLCQIKI
jgi:hypothetical protein